QGRVTALSNVNITFPVTTVAGRTGNVTLNAADISGLGTAATQNVGTASGNVLQLNGSAQIPAVDGSLLTNVNAGYILNRQVGGSNPTAGQVLTYNNSTNRWDAESTAGGTVTQVNSGNGLLGGPITGVGTLSVNTGVGANQIVQLTASAQYPGTDGYLISNIN